jgi:hypothetical protein
MLVEVRKLRDKDVKLTPEEVRAQRPLIGRLRYDDNEYGGRDGRGRKICLLMPVDVNVTEPLIQLVRASIKIEPRGILIRGEEEFFRRSDRYTYRQALWCKPLSDSGVQVRVTAPSTLPNPYATAGKRVPA